MSSLEEQLGEFIRGIVREELRRALQERQQGNAFEHVTLKAYAARRSISVSTVRNAIREGRLPALKIGRAVRVRADAEIGTRHETPATSGKDAAMARALKRSGVR
jgi:excisionase family DNA binding protein